MITKDQVFPVGQIVKPHGVNGEMSFTFTTDVFDRREIPFFILEMDGILVPFFLKGYRLKSISGGLLQLEGVDTDEKARAMSGLTIYLDRSYLEEVEDDEIQLDYFAGFLLIDTEKGEIGRITEVDQTTDNALFVIPKEDDELLIPVGDDYIVSIDHESKIITVSLPEGLLEL